MGSISQNIRIKNLEIAREKPGIAPVVEITCGNPFKWFRFNRVHIIGDETDDNAKSVSKKSYTARTSVANSSLSSISLNPLVTELNLSCRTTFPKVSTCVRHTLLGLQKDMLVCILSFCLDDFAELVACSSVAYEVFQTALDNLTALSIPLVISRSFPLISSSYMLTTHQKLTICRFLFDDLGRIKVSPNFHYSGAEYYNAYQYEHAFYLGSDYLTIPPKFTDILVQMLVGAWNLHFTRILPAIEAALKLRIMKVEDLRAFHGLMTRFIFQIAAGNFHRVLKGAMVFILQREVPFDWNLLAAILVLAVENGAETAALVIVRQYLVFKCASQLHRIPTNQLLLKLISKAIKKRMFNVTNMILEHRLCSARHSLLRPIILEAIAFAPIKTIDILYQAIIHQRFGLGQEVVRWDRVDVLVYFDGKGMLEDNCQIRQDWTIVHEAAMQGSLACLR